MPRDFGSSVGTAPAAASFAGAAVSLQSTPLKSALQAVQIAAQLLGYDGGEKTLLRAFAMGRFDVVKIPRGAWNLAKYKNIRKLHYS